MKRFYRNKDLIICFEQVSYLRVWDDCVDVYLVGKSQPTVIMNKNSLGKIVEDFKAYTDCYEVDDLLIPLANIQCVFTGGKSAKVEIKGMDSPIIINRKPSVEKFAREYSEYLEEV